VGAVTLTARGNPSGIFKWYDAESGGNLLQTSASGQTANVYVTPPLSVTTIYYVSRTNTLNCEGPRVGVTATVNQAATEPSVTGGSRCGTGTVLLSVSSSGSGVFRWYTALTGGAAFRTSPSASSDNYTTGSLAATRTYYVTFNNGNCESTPRTPIVATVNPVPAAPTVTVGSNCGPGSVVLSVGSTVAGTFSWYSASTGGTPLQASAAGLTSDSFITPSISASTTYFVSVRSAANCEGARRSVAATINTLPAAPTVTPGSTCGSGTVTLAANSAIAGTFKWYDAVSGGNLLQTSAASLTTNSFTTPSLTASTTYYVTITNSLTCESATRTAVIATVNVNSPATQPSLTNRSRCGTGTVQLTASSSTSGTFRWYNALTGGTLLRTSGAATSDNYTTPSISATTSYFVTFNNGTCESTPRSAITATINPVAAVPTPSGGTRCSTGAVTLSATSATPGTFKWYLALTGGTAQRTSAVAQTTDSFTTPSIAATTTYYVTFTNASGCESAPRTAVAATITPSPTVFTLSGGGNVGSGSLPVSLSGSQTGTSYQLVFNGANLGAPISGTSEGLSWAVSQEGTYTVNAQVGSCNVPMAGSAIFTSGLVPDQVEFNALKDLFTSASGANWTNKTNWPSTWPATANAAQMGTWFGVTVENGDVTSLYFQSNNLVGSMPSSIGNLTALKVLNMRANSITGQIPTEWSTLVNLTDFEFSHTAVSGNLPTYFKNFPNLVWLSVISGNLTGDIPDYSGLNNLRLFGLSGNFTPGPIPDWIGTLPSLAYFSMTYANRTGSIPAWVGNKQTLIGVSFDTNQLTGEIPTSIGGLAYLTGLNLNNNQLSGALPANFLNAANIQTLFVANNQLTGALPNNYFTGWNKLTSLNLSGNKFTSVPNLSTNPNKANLTVAVENNLLDFSSIEPMVNQGLQAFTYTPQKTINDNLTLGFTSSGLLITPRNPGLNSTITWEKQINNAWTNVNASNQDATQSTFRRDSPSPTDEGIYRWTMTNSVVTGLTLQSEPITVISEGVVPDAIEYAALKDLFTNTNGAGWTNKTNWPTTWPATVTAAEMDSWYGITVANNDISEIDLSSNALRGEFPQSLFNLLQITNLRFRNNALTGQLPVQVPVGSNLSRLDLTNNQFGGELPVSMDNWNKLSVLFLTRNQISGPIPASIGNLPLLQYLGLGYNQLTGSLPEELFNLKSVYALYLNDNRFEGFLSPSIDKMTSLTEFWCFRSGLGGTLPASLGNLNSMRHLYLYSNAFTGEIPADWKKLTNMENFWIHFNQVSGPIPDWIGDWAKLNTLVLGDTKLTGPIPDSFSRLNNLTELYLQRLNISGPIPDTLQSLTKLRLVDFKFNNFEGQVPSWLMNRATMKTFILNDNKFTNVPDFSARTDKATLTINLENNQLDFSKLEQLKGLAITALTFTPQKPISDFSTIGYTTSSLVIPARPTGQYSTVVWEKQQPDGSWLNVNSVNQDPTQKTFAKSSPAASDLGVYRWSMTNTLVTGMTLQSVPIKTFNTDEYNALMDFYFSTNGDQWKNNTGWRDADPAVVQSAVGWYGVQTDASGRVTALDFDGLTDFSYINSNDGYQVYAGNNLSGTIPPSIKKLVWLQILNLGGNDLTGSIPNEITELSNLVWLIAPFNQLTGSIPTNIGNLTKLDRIFLESNQLSGAIPPSMGNLTNLWALQLMDNQLTGRIPSELGNLKKVAYFHLYNNKLSGSIPAELGNMTSCVNFGLQRNRLTGIIPPELSNMRNLRKLYIGENELTGSVPASLATVPNLRHIYLDKAKLSGPIPIAIGAIPGIQYIGVANNKFTFSDLIGLKQQLSTSGFNFTQLAANNIEFPIYQEADPLGVVKPLPVTPSFDYAPQDTVDIHRVIEVAYGSRSTLTATVDANTSPQSEIQWFKYVDGVKDQLLTEDPSIYSYTTSPLAEGDDGKMYYYQITNPILPDLVLKSRFQSVRIPYENLLIPGSVGIGTTKINGYRLSVNGKIRSLGAKVYLETQWSDFVFKPNYQLRSLKQLDQYIQANGHLPEMPSAAEVKKQGIELGKMDAKLLQKIEELTLYLIKMKKENEILKKEVKELQSKSN
jgi:Leucine-rich repeat (LRR) protein